MAAILGFVDGFAGDFSGDFASRVAKASIERAIRGVAIEEGIEAKTLAFASKN
jgi:hypothetical protein